MLTSILYIAIWVVLAIPSLGGIAYYLLTISSVRKLRNRQQESIKTSNSNLPAITLLKPLMGTDPGLESHLATFFNQDYPSFEIIFAVRQEDDPAVSVVRRLMAQYPQISTQLLITGEPRYANAKVYSMEQMAAAAQYSIVVITDSDVSVQPDYLKAMAQAFALPKVGAVTNLYRGVSEPDFWSKLEALGMSTEFMGGVVVAERLEGMKFTLGPSMAVRTKCLEQIGGFAAMADYLADDFVLGQWAAAAGYEVGLSTHVINHHASALGFAQSFRHRLRWNRSSRFSRPAGYIGQGFTYGLAWAIIFAICLPSLASLTILTISLLIRFWLALELGAGLLQDKTVLSRLALIPIQDLLSFATWVGGFLGREIIWRKERYRLLDGGRFAPITRSLSLD